MICAEKGDSLTLQKETNDLKLDLNSGDNAEFSVKVSKLDQFVPFDSFELKSYEIKDE